MAMFAPGGAAAVIAVPGGVDETSGLLRRGGLFFLALVPPSLTEGDVPSLRHQDEPASGLCPGPVAGSGFSLEC